MSDDEELNQSSVRECDKMNEDCFVGSNPASDKARRVSHSPHQQRNPKKSGDLPLTLGLIMILVLRLLH
jgi:hypothetical protein